MKLKSLLLGLIVPLLLVTVGVGVFVGMRPPEPPKVPALGSDRASLLSVMPTAEVQRVRALSELSETLDIEVSGTVVPYREINLAAEVAGKVIQKDRSVRSGNGVTKGQVLFQIDPRDYELEIERLTRRRDQELASLAELAQDIENSKRLMSVAAEEVELADADVRRLKGLDRSVASQTEVDRAKRSYLTAKNQELTLQNQLRSLETRADRLQLAAKLAETELEQAQVNLERTTVKAPVDGRIVSEQVEEDSFVQRGTQLLVIEDTSKVEVAANLRMNQLYWILDRNDVSTDQLINAAQASRYELPPIPVKLQFHVTGREQLTFEWDGVLDRYDGSGLDPQSRTVPVRIVVNEPGNFRVNGEPSSESQFSGPTSLVRGMFVDVVLQAKPATPLLLVPKLAIKPATFSNQIWKFVPDDAALEVAKQDNSRPPVASEAARDATADATAVDANPPAADKPSMAENRKEVIDPAAWAPGFLQIVEGALVVGAFNQGLADFTETGEQAVAEQQSTPGGEDAVIDYWICEVRDGSLSVGDQVIVSPLPGIEGDGRDTVRVKVP